MHKKSQVTVFIIIGIVLVIIASIVFLVISSASSSSESAALAVPISADGVTMLINNCLAKASEDAVTVLAFQGGSISPSEDSFVYDIDGTEFNINYAYDSGKTLVSKDDMAKELKSSVMNDFSSCIDFTAFKEQGYDIESSLDSLTVTINENNVVFDLDYPATLKKDDTTNQLQSKYTKIIGARLGHAHDIASKVVDDLADDPDMVHTGLLGSFDVSFDIIIVDESTVIYSLTDTESDIGKSPMIFMFGVRK